MKTANAGKHVLVEKPDAVNTTELQAMLDACVANNVQFMDAVMWMHNTRNGPLLEAIESIGPTRRVVSAFTFSGGDAFLASDNIRVRNDGTVRALETVNSSRVLLARPLSLCCVARATLSGAWATWAGTTPAPASSPWATRSRSGRPHTAKAT